MRPPAKRSSRRGLLLVEAVLSAVIIAVGLVFISRGLSSQLTALRSLEEYDTLASLAQSKLIELETERRARPSAPLTQEGMFDGPYADYRWSLLTTPRDGTEDLKANGSALTSDVTLTIERREGASAQQPTRPIPLFRLQAIWPTDWVLR